MVCVTCGAEASASDAAGGVSCCAGHFHCPCIRQRRGRLTCPAKGCGAAYPLAQLAKFIPDYAVSWPANDAQLAEVPKGTFEWSFVEQSFSDLSTDVPPSPRGRRRDLAAQFASIASVVKIERVENSELWRIYANTCQLLRQKHGGAGTENEVWVKHGTGATDPKIIWRSGVDSGAQGLDPAHVSPSSANMLGKGIYFATHSAYSHYGFRHEVPGQPGVASMFVVRFAAGLVEDREDGDGKGPRNEIRYPSQGFDTVRGHVGGPGLAYVMHRAGYSYPAYLVTYRYLNAASAVAPAFQPRGSPHQTDPAGTLDPSLPMRGSFVKPPFQPRALLPPGGLDPVGAFDPSLPMRGSFVSPPLAEVYWGQLSDRG